MSSNRDIASQIRAKWSCVAYARDILHLPVSKEGDRCTSISPGPHSHNDGFVVYNDRWRDYSTGHGGDVIALCAEAKYNGDQKLAFKELGAEFFTDSTPSTSYIKHCRDLEDFIDSCHTSLRQEDRDYLHDRRISDETIDRLKIGYCNNPRHGHFQRLIIPYWRNGHPVYYASRDRTGSGTKYKKAWTGKDEYTENTIWGEESLSEDWCGDIKNDESAAFRHKYLCILEGMFDAMSFFQERWHVISPIGGYFPGKLMPQIASIAREYEAVFLIFDNDTRGKSFQRAMAEFMFSHSIPFICGHTQNPDGSDSKFDVSDYYSHGGCLEDLVRNAVPGIQELAMSYTEGQEDDFYQFIMKAGRYVKAPVLRQLCKNVPLDKDYVDDCLSEARKVPRECVIADEIVAEHEIIYSVGDGFYEYDHGVWGELPSQAVQLYSRAKYGIHANSARMASTAKHIAALKWSTAQFNSAPVLNVMNGILDLNTLELREHTPSVLTTIQIPRTYNPEAKAPLTLQFLYDIFDGDEDSVHNCLRMMGYLLCPDCRFEKGFMLMGDGANGKSVLIELIRHVIDPRNCSNVDLSNMADRFDPLRLRHSLVNFSTETRVNLNGGEAAIKKVISGETISAAHKGVDAVEFVPRCKVICACNNFVASKDISYGFVRKLCFLHFPKTYTGKNADRTLLSRLKKEADGILNLMIEGYRELMREGGFIETDKEKAMREEFMMLANPVAGFIQMRLADAVGEYKASDLYQMYYVPWAKEANTGIVSLLNFSSIFPRLLKQLRPDVRITSRHKTKVYEFPDPEVPAKPQKSESVPEVPAMIQETESVPEVPAKPQETESVPEVPRLEKETVAYLNDVLKLIHDEGINPGNPEDEGKLTCWHTWQDVPSIHGKKVKDPRGWCRSWEELRDELYRRGYPSSLKHAILFRFLAGEPMFTAQSCIRQVMQYLEEHPEWGKIFRIKTPPTPPKGHEGSHGQ